MLATSIGCGDGRGVGGRGGGDGGGGAVMGKRDSTAGRAWDCWCFASQSKKNVEAPQLRLLEMGQEYEY
jgi:hypothetical protein